MNEMISCIRTERMQQFHQRYREADVLLIDDIQLLGNKERTQEEFFHTFNELHDHQKQIVISSDSPPKDIPGPAGAPALAFRVGAAGRHTAARPRDQDGHPGQEGRGGRRQTAGRRAHVHGVEDQIQRARAGRRAGEADRLFLADRHAHQPANGAAGLEAPGSCAGPPGDHRCHPESGGRNGSRSSSRSSRKRAIRRRSCIPGRWRCTW